MRYMKERIKIISTPPGQAPLWVREKWVGLVLPVAENDDGVGSLQVGVRGGRAQNLGGYEIETQKAIELLEEISPNAALWWKNNMNLEIIPRLVFRREVCEVVKEEEII